MFGKLLELITGQDNRTLEPAYVWWALSILVGLALEVFTVVVGQPEGAQPFNLQAYGIGVGALMIGAGWSKKVAA